MVVLIWFVQIVHYPLFRGVGEAGSAGYALEHQRRTTRVVGPAMLVEAGTAAWRVLRPPPGVRSTLPLWVGAGLLAVVWLSTALLQVPAHRALSEGFDPAAGARLVRTNWLRTLAWSARGVLAAWIVFCAGG